MTEYTTINVDRRVKKKLDKARVQLQEELGFANLSYNDVIAYLLRADDK